MNAKQIAKQGFSGRQIGLAQAAAAVRAGAGLSRREIQDELRAVQANPARFAAGGVYAELAGALLQAEAKAPAGLRTEPLPYRVWGAELVEAGALEQMNTAMRLPISRAGALMPDAHPGYGLPIGGVLATEGAVIPYGVGVDIGCSMMLSVLPVTDDLSTTEARRLLLQHTRFGAGVAFEKREREDHPVLHEDTWQRQGLLRSLHGKAAEQIGTSGSGNHFVEFGRLRVESQELGLEAGEYLALLSHSGSRGFGAQVAGHFTKLAEGQRRELPPEARKLAWLDLESHEGQAYWQAMGLAGRYALANHELIHGRIARALGAQPMLTVSNSHNLAWKDNHEGREVIVHRKGATPASAGQLGIIPGSMADPSFVTRGRGETESLRSASHGAGRRLGRKAAERSVSKEEMRAYLKRSGVELIGGGRDEAPQAYKRIEAVIARQRDLVNVLAEFRPTVVRMDSGGRDI